MTLYDFIKFTILFCEIFVKLFSQTILLHILANLLCPNEQSICKMLQVITYDAVSVNTLMIILFMYTTGSSCSWGV